MTTDFASNLALACHTWDISHHLDKAANKFPRDNFGLKGFSSRLNSLSKIFLFLSFAVNDLRSYRRHSLCQRHLNNCAQLISIFYGLQKLLQEYVPSNLPATDLFQELSLTVFGKEYMVSDVSLSLEFGHILREVENNALSVLISASRLTVDIDSWPENEPPALQK
jgi:hypothetical protein